MSAEGAGGVAAAASGAADLDAAPVWKSWRHTSQKRAPLLRGVPQSGQAPSIAVLGAVDAATVCAMPGAPIRAPHSEQ
jgi:hypothetical protein